VSAVKIDQAFVQAFIDGGFGLPIAHENIAYTPTTGTAFVELSTLANDVTGYDLSSRDITDGIFQAILRYPVGTGAIAAKTKAEEIFRAFPIGSLVEYDGQAATIASQQRQPGAATDGWYSVVITLGYRAKLARGTES